MNAIEPFHRLIHGWRGCSFNSKPYLFPGDLALLKNEESICVSRSFDEFIDSNFGSYSKTSLHIGLLPIPYVGNLENASIYVLMSNPGLSYSDYYAEDNNPIYREALIRNIRQEFDPTDFPFLFLNPRFAWHPGFGYWHGKFKGFAKAIRKEFECTYQDSLKYLAERIACLELIPYHSENFSGNVIKGLRSVEYMIEYAHSVLMPKADQGEAIIIVARGGKYWGMRQSKNILVYTRFESRAAHITPKTKKVGRLIAERLNLKSIT